MTNEHGAAAFQLWNSIGKFRIGVGAAQGLALFVLHETSAFLQWGGEAPAAHGALFLACLYAPLVLLAGAGRLRWRTLWIWFGVAAAALAALAVYDIVRQIPPDGDRPYPTFSLYIFSAIGLFVAHHLVTAGAAARSAVAPYAVYFDQSWRNGVQLLMSAAFVGAFWALLHIGAALFSLIELRLVMEVLHEPWFYYPVTALAFATAVHLTDVQEALLRSASALALTLLSWLLPVFTAIIAAFLLTLPFNSLEPLWRTGSATALLLGTAGALVFLINAAYQQGVTERWPRWTRIAATAASLALIPLTALATYALWLRIAQYGLTPERVAASALCLIAALYAAGYGAAALLRGAPLALIERVNVAAAATSVVAIVLLLSPFADPARLAADDQMRRLEQGLVTPERFDFSFLRSGAGRYGREALERLKHSENVLIAQRAQAAEEEPVEPRRAETPMQSDVRAALRVFPSGRSLPEDFLASWPDDTPGANFMERCRQDIARCAAVLADVDGDRRDEVLIDVVYATGVFRRGDTGDGWIYLGELAPMCGLPMSDDLRAGKLSVEPAELPDLIIGGRRVRIEPPNC